MYQGRDEKGRFGNGTSPHSDETDAGSTSAGGSGDLLPRIRAVVYGAVGHLSPSERAKYTAHLDHGGLLKLSESLLAWSRESTLDRDTFRERFLGGAGSDEAVDHLRKAAEGAAKATTIDEQRDAAGELAAAYRSVGPDRWPRFVAAAHEHTMAAGVSSAGGGNKEPVVTRVQELLLSPRIPFLAEPPKGIIPRLMERIPRRSGKEAADNVPSWARGIPRRVGETPRDYAKRLMDGRYGPGNWDTEDTGPTSDFSRIRKFGERAFRNPKESAPASPETKPEA
jgi:hypothetical protein